MSLDLVLCSQGNIPCPLWIEVPEAGKELQSPTQAALWCVSGHMMPYLLKDRQFLSIPHGRGIFNQGQSHLRCHDQSVQMDSGLALLLVPFLGKAIASQTCLHNQKTRRDSMERGPATESRHRQSPEPSNGRHTETQPKNQAQI